MNNKMEKWLDGLAFTNTSGDLPETPIDIEELNENCVPYQDFGVLDDTGTVVGEGMDMAADLDMWPEDLLARLADTYQDKYLERRHGQ